MHLRPPAGYLPVTSFWEQPCEVGTATPILQINETEAQGGWDVFKVTQPEMSGINPVSLVGLQDFFLACRHLSILPGPRRTSRARRACPWPPKSPWGAGRGFQAAEFGSEETGDVSAEGGEAASQGDTQ